MLNWMKNTHVPPSHHRVSVPLTCSSVGITEPIYGPHAIQSVAGQAQTTPWTELQKDDFKWEGMDSTNVETQTFYMIADSGEIGMAQIIYSNVMGVRTTAQFNAKVFSKEPGKPHLWSSDPLEHWEFSEDRLSFKARNCSVEMSADGKSYAIKSSTNKKSVVDLKFTQAAPSFVVGRDGTSYFGTDPQQPWGRMRHAFWPRCRVEGNIITQKGSVDFKGRGLYVHALQGMKPHHAAARWNFVNFQSPTYSAIMMEFTTPKSYGETVVNVGGIALDGEILCAGAENEATHAEIKGDPENDWPEPGAVSWIWKGKTKDGKTVVARIEGPLGERLDRVDVMAEVPKFVKQIVAGAAGTKPYIYQWGLKMMLKIRIGDDEREEEGQLFSEATFIC